MNEIITKIRKLLELSKSTNEHEAANAAARAADLMLKHQIEEAEITAMDPAGPTKPDPLSDEQIDQSGKAVSWKQTILGGLARAFGGSNYYRRGSRKWGDKCRDYVVAPASAMPTIKYMYSYLVLEVDRLADIAYGEEVAECKKSFVSPPGARAWKTSFRVGAADVIHNRLSEQRRTTFATAKAEGKSQALAVIDRQQEALEQYKRKAHPGLFNRRTGKPRRGSGHNAGRSSASGYDTGRAAGQNVNLPGASRQIGEGNKRLS